MLWTLIIGAISGWIAGIIRQGYGFGLFGNIIVGVVGAFIGSWLFQRLSIRVENSTVGTVITSVVGALALLFLIGLFKSKK